MKKVVIVVGTRPNFVKITQFEKMFAQHGSHFEYKLVHTGQHYDENMSKVFFEQFGLKEPDIYLQIKHKSVTEQIAEIIRQLGDYFKSYMPDLVIVVGDVNSTLAAALAAQKSGVKIAHLESGLRSYDRDMPEEINRILTDSITDIFFVTEQSGLDNLSAEFGNRGEHIFVGNTMIDTLVAFDDTIQKSTILDTLSVQGKDFGLVTIHRPSNVDTKASLEKVVHILNEIAKDAPIVFPMHPRTKKNLEKFGLEEAIRENNNILVTGPMDYISFQKLIASAKYILTDSGGIQEEASFRQVPCLTLRENTERPSTIDIGSNVLVPLDAMVINTHIKAIFAGEFKEGEIPPLWDGKATQRIVNYLKENV